MEATAKANIHKFWRISINTLKIPWWNPCSARCELGRLFSRVIIKRVILQNSLHIKLDYHYVYLVKDCFLLRTWAFSLFTVLLWPHYWLCYKDMTGYKQWESIFGFFLQIRIIFASELDTNKQKMKHTLGATWEGWITLQQSIKNAIVFRHTPFFLNFYKHQCW